jgi:TatD DNase family protein
LNHQCEWALSLNLPVALHTRESMDDALELIKPFSKRGLKGVFHCFSGNEFQAKQALDLGFYLGIGGTVTYKNNPLGEVLAGLDKPLLMKQLLLETDSPYLAPLPYRGKRNESAYLPLVLHKLGEVLSIPMEEIAAQTTKNACELFSLSL